MMGILARASIDGAILVLIVWIVRWIWGWGGPKPDEGTTTPPATGPVSDV